MKMITDAYSEKIAVLYEGDSKAPYAYKIWINEAPFIHIEHWDTLEEANETFQDLIY